MLLSFHVHEAKSSGLLYPEGFQLVLCNTAAGVCLSDFVQIWFYRFAVHRRGTNCSSLRMRKGKECLGPTGTGCNRHERQKALTTSSEVFPMG